MKWRLIPLLFCLIIYGLTLSGCAALQKLLKSEEAPEVRLEKIFLERALEYERQGEPRKALQAYEAALAVVVAKKGGLEASLRSAAERHYRRGLELKEQGQHARARHEFLAALRLWPEFPEVVDQLKPSQQTRQSRYVVHQVKEGEYLSAIAQEYYNDQSKYEVIARYNNLEDAAKLYTGMQLKIPEIEGVRFIPAKGREAVRSSPGEKDPGKAVTKFKQKPTGEASGRTARQAVRAKPPGSGEAAAYPQVADEPMVGLGEAVDYDPLVICQEHGVSLLEEGQYLAALHEFQRVLEADPSQKQVLAYMTWAHYRQGEAHFQQAEYLEARRHFQEALSLDQECTSCREYLKRTEDAYKEAHYLKGIKHFEEESLQEAIEEWQRVSELDSDYKQVQNYLLRAQKLLDKVQEIKEAP